MENLLEIKNLKKYFYLKNLKIGAPQKLVKAVDNINLKIKEGQGWGIVGESGCGKTTLSNLILGIHQPTDGEIIFQNKILNKLKIKEQRKMRRKMSVVFQNPFSSLNPRKTVYEIINESVNTSLFKKNDCYDLINLSVESVGLKQEDLFKYPHEFSGGQRQRIAIARTLINKPTFIIFDEPTSGLDVSIQAQIINLLKKIRDEYEFSYLFISHNLSVVKYISNIIAVMYLGQIVEITDTESFFKNPLHPYSKLLLSSIPDLSKINMGRNNFQPSQLIDDMPKDGICNFYPRCQFRKKECLVSNPILKNVEENHLVMCNLI
jgi:peptide/nickel transport system ATP-binding protein